MNLPPLCPLSYLLVLLALADPLLSAAKAPSFPQSK